MDYTYITDNNEDPMYEDTDCLWILFKLLVLAMVTV